MRSLELLIISVSFSLGIGLAADGSSTEPHRAERLIPAGSYLPFFASIGSIGKLKTEAVRKPVELPPFWLDVLPVTNGDYLKFLRTHPEWRRSKVARVFSDDAYLKHWKSDLRLRSAGDRHRPVIHVSWFSASAYCQAQGKELPSTDQWEYAAEDAGRNSEPIKNRILAWYGVPNSQEINQVGKQDANGYGISDLHGLIWEWTLDFNSAMIGSELRNDGTKDDNLFCGAGSLNALDPSDYAKFMRTSFRSSLRADYTTANLGFRCAREVVK